MQVLQVYKLKPHTRTCMLERGDWGRGLFVNFVENCLNCPQVLLHFMKCVLEKQKLQIFGMIYEVLCEGLKPEMKHIAQTTLHNNTLHLLYYNYRLFDTPPMYMINIFLKINCN